MMKEYEVEFWPGQKYRVEAFDEHDAIHKLLADELVEYPGGMESTPQGERAMIWVREVPEPEEDEG